MIEKEKESGKIHYSVSRLWDRRWIRWCNESNRVSGEYWKIGLPTCSSSYSPIWDNGVSRLLGIKLSQSGSEWSQMKFLGD